MKYISARSTMWVAVVIGSAVMALTARAHDIITTSITWNREVSRILAARCISCHKEGGTAFSLSAYKEAYPWKTAIHEEILQRRMPPWGAVKGFGDFRNDQSLTPEQIEIISSWTQGGAPEGELKDLPVPPKPDEPKKETGWAKEVPDYAHPAGEILVSGELTLVREFVLEGIWPKTVPDRVSAQITAELPDGRIEPLVWLLNYKPEFGHPFLFRTPISLPRGTVIRGIPADASVFLLPAANAVQDDSSSLTPPPVQK